MKKSWDCFWFEETPLTVQARPSRTFWCAVRITSSQEHPLIMGSKCLTQMNMVLFFMPLSMVLEKLMKAIIYSPQKSTHNAATGPKT